MIDLRSDLVSVPTDEMWEAMRGAELGWATIGEDASVQLLCERAAELLGKPAATWVPTCGMANLAAMLTFCEPGDRVVLEAASHVLTSEAMGIVEIGRLEPRTIVAPDGRMDPTAVEELVAAEQAALLVLENTHTRAGGTTLSVDLSEALAAAARRHGAGVHLDGARLVNAAAALGVPLAALAASADTVALSLNKGLSAPMGTILAGEVAFIERARLMLLRLGGATMHRAGIPAAAGLVALETMIERIAEDNRRARALGRLLTGIPGLDLRPGVIETNIVFVEPIGSGLEAAELVRRLAERGVRGLEVPPGRVRFVTHRLVGDAEIERAAEIVAAVVAQAAPSG